MIDIISYVHSTTSVLPEVRIYSGQLYHINIEVEDANTFRVKSGSRLRSKTMGFLESACFMFFCSNNKDQGLAWRYSDF